jgi:hypothetical protein
VLSIVFVWPSSRFGAARFGAGIDTMLMKRHTKFRGEAAAECEVGVRFSTAETVVQMRCMEHQAEFPALLHERTEQRNRIGATRKTHGKTQTRAKQGCIENQT